MRQAPSSLSRALVLCAGLLSTTPALAQAGNARALALARTSPTARTAYADLLRTARGLRDKALREATVGLLENPRPTFTERLALPEARERVRAQLVEQGLLDAAVTLEQLFPPLPPAPAAPQPFLSAPGQAVHGHHGYPGGLAEHTAFNTRSGLALVQDYERVYGFAPGTLRSDWVAAAAILHDAMKPWVLQWQPDGGLTTQPRVGGTASHHAFIVAEALHRELPAAFVVVLASAHEAPLGPSAAHVVDYLRAGALLAGVDPVEAGLLRKGGQGFELAAPAPAEAVIHHLSDHDYVLTDPAAGQVEALLDQLAQAEAGAPLPGSRLRWMHHRVQALVPGVVLYTAYARGGEAAVRTALRERHIPLLSDADASAAEAP
ncbi:hypothetical protein FGE12_13340 [Aggregicoccus sp. 17bor-14]|uniref:hypothetical protein n=1 Tax=Myxococcaceae TaxID=31 RepID=UPI00129C67AA|nr:MULTISPECIES: hypothetical protein [Myxococcaceae]MBF5043375.1 hypothetical protein [Simulacricoccus sp. 17bor-14]MRI89133.1 hypothetical protein [Aggregicoccus sp. 17bor-14]